MAAMHSTARWLPAAALACLVSQCVSQWSQIYVDGPSSPKQQPTWLQQQIDDREVTLQSIDWHGGVFDKLKWTQTSYIQPQMHPYDRYFYDPDSGNYTVQRYLKDLKDRYGGIDALLLWPTYTNIGVDDRNQFDYFRAMPGGLDGVARITAELKKSGVRVLWPYNPWDTGTRREPFSDGDTFAHLLKQTGGDGINGDTMDHIPKSFWTAALKNNYPYAFEPEDGGTDQALNWSTMGWGYWAYPKIPVVDRFKFITSGKFMTNVCDRWAHSKTDNLQMAWFNGDGYETWENVWGNWNGITPHDAEAIRRVAAMLRYFGKEGFLQSPGWEPHAREILQEDAFASRWPLPEKNATLWTIVNRGYFNLTSSIMRARRVPDNSKLWYYDCYAGKELTPSPGPAPTPVPEGYHFFKGANSWHGFGGLEIDEYPMLNTSVAECTALCDGDLRCSCVAYYTDGNQCWRRADCQPAQFQYDTDFSVYMKKQGFTEYPNSGCGQSCVDIDTADTAGKGLSLLQCEARCNEDPSCQCAKFIASDGQCWRHSDCTKEPFEASPGSIILMNEARRPAAPIVPEPPVLSFPLEVNGYGCVLELPAPATGSVATFLDTMKEMTQHSLSSFSETWTYLNQKMVDIPQTKLQKQAPKGMVKIPKGDFFFSATGIELEGTDSDGVDVQFPWELHPQQSHQKQMQVEAFFMDKFPVTTTQYAEFIEAVKYVPADPYNWLKNWGSHATKPPPELANMPVTYVSLKEARAYCS